MQLPPRFAAYPQTHFSPRLNSNTDRVHMAWSIGPEEARHLLCGFCLWDGESAPAKTLDYEEVIVVLKGVFGIEWGDGQRHTAHAGDVIHIPWGSTVRYFGKQARVFFTVTPPGQVLPTSS